MYNVIERNGKRITRKYVVIDTVNIKSIADYDNFDDFKVALCRELSLTESTAKKLFGDHISYGGKKKSKETKKETDKIFSAKDELEKLLKSEQRLYNVLGIYWKAKKFKISNMEQLKLTLFNGRNLIAAKRLGAFSDEDIIKAIVKVDKHARGNDYKWSMDTVLKFIIK